MQVRIGSMLAAGLLALAAAGVHAQHPAVTAETVHLRAGPGRGYPVVAILAPHLQITVFACISGYSWCDVQAGPERGWVYAGNVLYVHGSRPAVLPSVAPVIGIGTVVFIMDDYWHAHYVDRWWWPQRQQWYRPPPLHSQPPHAFPARPPGRPPPPHVDRPPQVHRVPPPGPHAPAARPQRPPRDKH